MKYFRNPTIVKIVMLFTFIAFAITSLSPDFMFNMLGSNSTEPFIETIYQGCLSWGSAIGWNIGNRKEAGVFVMLVFLIIVLISYFTYKTLKIKFKHNENANK